MLSLLAAPGNLTDNLTPFIHSVPSPPTAIMQTTARKNAWPLDKMCLTVDVTKKHKEDYGHPPREGAYLHGLFMEGRPPRSARKAMLGRSDLVSHSSQYLPFVYSFSVFACVSGYLPHFLLFKKLNAKLCIQREPYFKASGVMSFT